MINRFLCKKLSSFQIICMGFVGAILLGTILLRLPLATRDGNPASWEDALFTAASAVCVTGLVVRDTALYWAPFGQAVILVLISVLLTLVAGVIPARSAAKKDPVEALRTE